MQFVQLLISGVSQGCIYGLIALGFVLIYKATETVSFAQGELMMLGAFCGLALMTVLGFPFWVAVLASILAMGCFGVVLERAVIRPILGQPAFSIVMLTIGIGYVLRGLVTMIPNIGTETHTLPVPYKDLSFRLGALVLNAEQLVVIGATGVLCVLLFAMFRYSKLGIAMQASSQNQLAAYYMGIPVQRLNGLRGLVTMIPNIGTETHTLPVPYKDLSFRLGALVLNAEQLVVIGATGVLCVLLFAMFRYSKLGIAMQASSQNQLAAYYMGIPVQRLNGLAWGLAAVVAAVAGLLLAPITFVHANMGLIGLKAFPAAVVGGFGSLPGAIVGGLVIGIVESLSGFYLPDGFKDTAAYIVVLIMLMVKPNGLFGEKLRKKV